MYCSVIKIFISLGICTIGILPLHVSAVIVRNEYLKEPTANDGPSDITICAAGFLACTG